MTGRHRFILLTGILVGAGFLLRFYLLQFAYRNLVWDMAAYYEMAVGALEGRWVANSYTHGPGYSLFLAAILSVFGRNNLDAVRLIQVILDTGSGLALAAAAGRIFGKKTILPVLFLYALNPFTAAYAGFILSETLAVSCVSVLLLLFSLGKKDSSGRVWVWMPLGLGIVLGGLAVTKISLYYFLLASVAGLTAWLIIRTKRILTSVLLPLGFCAFLLYPLTANRAVFGAWTVMPPYRSVGSLLYAGFWIGKYPELRQEYDSLHVRREYAAVTEEFYEYVNKRPERFEDFRQEYARRFQEKLRVDWPLFIRNTAEHAYYLWDKPYVFMYEDPLYPRWSWVYRLSNWSLIALGCIGFLRQAGKWREDERVGLVGLFTAALIGWMTVMLAMVTSETRVSIPAYPLLIFWAGQPLSALLSRVTLLYNMITRKRKVI